MSDTIVVLPAPDTPTRASVSPGAMSSVDVDEHVVVGSVSGARCSIDAIDGLGRRRVAEADVVERHPAGGLPRPGGRQVDRSRAAP